MEPPSERSRNLRNSPFRRQIPSQGEQQRRAHPSGINFEANPGPAKFKLRTPEAFPAVKAPNACYLDSARAD
eukprot:13131072-Alexandrium_andersonii.AAC.1